MTSEKFSASKRKPVRYSLVSLIPVLILAFCIGAAVATEQISETESIIHQDTMFAVAIPMFLVVSILIFGIFYGIYRNEKYYFDGNRINHEFTFIVKKKVSLPLEKINIVKIKRTIFDLMLGTSVVEIGSGSMMSGLKSEIKLCLNKQLAVYVADYLQRYSKSIKEGHEFNELLQIDGELSAVLNKDNHSAKTSMKMTIGDKFRLLFTGPIMISILMMVVFIPLFLLFIHFIDPEALINEETLETVSNWEAYAIGLVISLSLSLVSLIPAILHVFLKYYNYVITKNEDGISIEYGLINRRSYLITFDKIHGYIVGQNPLQQLLKFGNLRLCVIGIDEQGGNNNAFSVSYLYPCGNLKKLNQIIATFLPSYIFDGALTKSTKKSALHTILIPIATTLVLLLPISLYLAIKVDFHFLAVPFVTVIVFGLLSRILVYKNAALGINDKFICTQSGGLLKALAVIKTSSVQEISTYAGCIRQRDKLCTYFISYRGSNLLTSKIFVRNIPVIELHDLK